jgi:ribosomal protein S18 acetylase RimI-like enzyme
VSDEKNTSESGFLITAMSPDELAELLGSGSRMAVAQRGEELLGYALMCPSNYLRALAPSFTPSSGEPLALSRFDYLLQIAVQPESRRRGIALELMSVIRPLATRGLVADVLLEPIENAASLAFFGQAGFERIGSFQFDAYPGIGPHRSAVFLWQTSAS